MRGRTPWLWRGIGAAVVLLPLVPVPALVGAPDAGPVWLPHLQAWGTALATIAVVGGLLAWAARRMPPHVSRQRVPPWPAAVFGALVVTILATMASHVVFAGNPHLVDEMAQLLHARAFATGRLALPAPEVPEAVLIAHTWITDAGWISQYPPGQTALFALGLLAGRPEWINPLLAGGGTILLFIAARGLYGSRTAVTAVAFWVLSAWVVFMSASFMNHVGAAVFGLAAWAAVLGPRRPRWWHFALAGTAIGLVTVTRPLDGVVVAIPLAIWAIRRRAWRGLVSAAAGGLPLAIVWGWLNLRIHGDPFTLGYSILYGEEHGMGFHTDPWGNPFTPAVALSNLVVAVRRLHIYLYEWPVPGVLLLGVWALARTRFRRADQVLGITLLATAVAYSLYWHSGFFLGPRFYFIAAPALILATARAWRWAWRLARSRARVGFRPDVGLATAATAVVVWGVVGVLPARVDHYRGSLGTFKLDPAATLAARGVVEAVVLVPESFGARTIVGFWGLGARPGLVERAYRWLDGCEMHTLLARARVAGWSGEHLERELTAAMAARPDSAPRVRDWRDGTLRLDVNRQHPIECVNAIRRDREGFTLFGPHAWRNPLNLDSGVVFLRETEGTDALLERWPGRQVWRFAPPPAMPDALPVLTLIRPTP